MPRLDRFATAIFVAAGAAVVALAGFLVWLELAHPCVRHAAATCTQLACAAWYNNNDGVMYCSVYVSTTYPCLECVERAP